MQLKVNREEGKGVGEAEGLNAHNKLLQAFTESLQPVICDICAVVKNE